MLKLAHVFTAVLLVCAAPAAAERLTLSGTVGTAPVLLTLDDDQGTLAGWYVYLRVGKQIRLEGRRIEDGAFTLDEFAATTGTRTGAFAGTVAHGTWTGSWRKTEAATALPVALSENRESLAALTGTFRCAARKTDRQFGYRYRYDMTLRVSKGKADRFDLSQRATSTAGDDQGCALGLDDLTQQAAAAGLLFMTEGDDDKARCTVRVISAGDYLYVKIGNGGQEGRDCRSSDAAMYCSPRSFWTDLIVDRKASTCRPVE